MSYRRVGTDESSFGGVQIGMEGCIVSQISLCILTRGVRVADVEDKERARGQNRVSKMKYQRNRPII